MKSAGMDVVLAAGNLLGEGILWCERSKALFWTDIQRATLYRLDPEDGTLRQWPMPERLASFALCEAEGWLLLALASRLAFFRLADGELRWLHDIEPGLPTRCNDGACDRQGRFVFATLHESREGPPQPMGGLWRLGLDLELERLPLPAVAIGNSIAFSPDGGVLYYCDSPTRRIQCCPYGDALGAPRLFVELDDGRGVPDGSCVDSQGHLWNAQWGLGQVVRYAPDGEVRQIVTLPTPQPTRPAFGGPGLDRLYVTSAREGLVDAGADAARLAGALFQYRPNVRGLPEPRFAASPD
ncbi:SMP-30/gluconolactonase/LRE family protein [Pseudomonas paraeruginosa]|uniref:SMP-30/gluconolactonase/LRE family protein n=2 Tax=Pseudomonas paraeruginosa TaxID=2994495 RepID=UPI001A1F9907|nr:SMP-30/gluconolactonase/LRE family protein [Pseudomonas aeruginosa]MBG7026019.1 SMP-30/gluconolactonase/LRE family protein [Pseudomonas aeruginosa]MBG7371656.1 SMP-30/gluconolactonase/LRE family protein [Pseudomonas aeruginosa]MCR3764366.1 SMP-30/gluconolactonase/LRE family protein [Pseudomonas aeruginosa]